MPIETNSFKITGLDDLKITYRLFQIVGLRRDGMDYYGNVQKLSRRLSSQMRAPVTTYERNDETFALVPEGYGEPPSEVLLVGGVAMLRDKGDTIVLSFRSDGSNLDPIRMRFLQFSVESPLRREPRLWRPGSGRPFFFRKPGKALGDLDLYEGFTVRVVPHSEGGFGVMVDLRRKLVARLPLSDSIMREEVARLKGRSCLYRMGNDWYEISLSGLSDAKVGERSIPLDGKAVSLIDYLHTRSSKPVPPSIAGLSPEGAAVYYRENGPEQRSAPAALCHLIEDTHAESGARHQSETTVEPGIRYHQINRIVRMFLGSLLVGGVELKVSEKAGFAEDELLPVPTLLFGNDRKLKPVDDGNDLDMVRDYSRLRLRTLEDSSAGFFEQSLLARQYFIVPKSVHNSSGAQFLHDLKAQMKSFYPSGGDYDPEVIAYDDLTGSRDFAGQSRAIRAALEVADVQPGFGLLMVHRAEQRPRSADKLAAWAVKELAQKFQMMSSVIHTDMVRRAYTTQRRGSGIRYVAKESEQRRLRGYIRNVVLNKILLTNGKWPFVLDTPLNADVVIGIDVKNSTSAFTLIAGGGRIIRFSISPSRQKERLLKNQVAQYVADLLRKERRNLPTEPAEIVVHRDGSAWDSEIEGLKEACRQLAIEGVISEGWRLNIVEIAKSAPAPMRIFDVNPGRDGRETVVENPVVGSWVGIGDNEGFVCTTGRPFTIPGTARPLHVKRRYGEMPIESCLSDVFDLSCLTWGRPESAMRLPISIKLCDRSLFEEAEDVNVDEVEFGSDDVADAS
jgi:Piwi domain